MNISNIKRTSNLTNFDVIVVGSGAAGLYAALRLPSHYRVGIVTKSALKTGSSPWAQGGIAAAISSNDSPNIHLEDTLNAGVGLCDVKAVEFLVDKASEEIEFLLKLGVVFDRHEGELATTLEAAHSRPRILHSQDTTGRAIIDVLTARVLECSNIQVFSQALVLSLWLHPYTNRCQGVSLLYQNQIQWLQAGAVILATGGCGQVFSKTTNPDVSTGDGVALAWRAGGVLRDLEFVQFHPTALSKLGTPNFLISEAVRGEGAHLVDDQGQRFAFDYHPEGEMAPRDVVSRAIFQHLQRAENSSETTHVYLDLRTISRERVCHRFPNIIKQCQQWGVDVFQQRIPVAPAAHYWMGGIAVDVMNSTSIAGLYALGETASTGVHGANRLASNSLLECIVFAAQFNQLHIPPVNHGVEQTVRECTADWSDEMEIINEIRNSLPILMWNSAGICRSLESLSGATNQVNIWRSQLNGLQICQFFLNVSPQDNIKLVSENLPHQLKTAVETMNLLDISHLILKSATFRQESRGGHYRIDFPETISTWQTHTLLQSDQIQTQSLQVENALTFSAC